MDQVMQSPLMQQMMNSPELMRSMMMANPQVRLERGGREGGREIGKGKELGGSIHLGLVMIGKDRVVGNGLGGRGRGREIMMAAADA
jgi:hypothetical protein